MKAHAVAKSARATFRCAITQRRISAAAGSLSMMRTACVLVVFGSLWAAGCGGGGGTTSDGSTGGVDSGGVPGASTMTWKDNGTAHSAIFASGALVTGSRMDLVQITGADATGSGLSFGVATAPPLVAAAYACADNGTGGRIVSISYSQAGVTGLATSCDITFTTLGRATPARAAGTFAGTFSVNGGAPRQVTEGRFDVAVIVSAGP